MLTKEIKSLGKYNLLFCWVLVVQVFLAVDLAVDCKDTQADLWNRICRDEYMAYAVQECYYSVEKVLHSLVDGEGRLWYVFLDCDIFLCLNCDYRL